MASSEDVAGCPSPRILQAPVDQLNWRSYSHQSSQRPIQYREERSDHADSRVILPGLLARRESRWSTDGVLGAADQIARP